MTKPSLHTDDYKKRLKFTAIEIASLNKSDLAFFFDTFFHHIPDDKRQYCIDDVLRYQYKDKGKWLEIDKWMDGCFTKKYKYLPINVARMCCNYWKINRKMMPLLIKKAQRSKLRVYKRRARANPPVYSLK